MWEFWLMISSYFLNYILPLKLDSPLHAGANGNNERTQKTLVACEEKKSRSERMNPPSWIRIPLPTSRPETNHRKNGPQNKNSPRSHATSRPSVRPVPWNRPNKESVGREFTSAMEYITVTYVTSSMTLFSSLFNSRDKSIFKSFALCSPSRKPGWFCLIQ